MKLRIFLSVIIIALFVCFAAGFNRTEYLVSSKAAENMISYGDLRIGSNEQIISLYIVKDYHNLEIPYLYQGGYIMIEEDLSNILKIGKMVDIRNDELHLVLECVEFSLRNLNRYKPDGDIILIDKYHIYRLIRL